MDHTKAVVFLFVALGIVAPVTTEAFHEKLSRDTRERKTFGHHLHKREQIRRGCVPEEIVVKEPPSTDELLKTVLQFFPQHNFTIAVSVANHLSYQWTLIGYDKSSMTSLPEDLPTGKALIAVDYGNNSTDGIFAYYIPETSETLAFFYDVERHKSIWNVRSFDGYREIDGNIVLSLKGNDTKRGDNKEYEGSLGKKFRFQGTMTYSCHQRKIRCDPTLKIYVLRK